MKRIVTALAITSTLVFIQACASQVKSSETSESSSYNTTTIADANSHAGHNAGDSTTAEVNENSHNGHEMESSHNEHSSHSKLESASGIVDLVLPTQITPKKPVVLMIKITDTEGKVIADFDKFQEQLMHLIVVSDDLQYFKHIHPTYKGDGRFEVQTDFPHPGSYTLFSDYKVAGKAEQVSVLKAKALGTAPAISNIDFATTKTFGNTKVNLKLSQSKIKAGQEAHVIFNLKDTDSGQNLQDLQPYLGEKGHLVILKQSSPLTQEDYIHAHAMKNSPAEEIHFVTNFPKAGKYKIWGQFNRNGEIITADFWVDVQ